MHHTISLFAWSLALAGVLFAAGVGLVALIGFIADRNR
jgi:hypothetical protein